MKSVFLDSSVLISFCASTTGASAFVLKLCREGKLEGHISERVILEVRKNTQRKLGKKATQRFERILKENFLVIEQDAKPELVEKSETVIRRKDAPILATAIESQVKFLLTLDKHDFMKTEVATFASQLKIFTPGDFAKKYLREKTQAF